MKFNSVFSATLLLFATCAIADPSIGIIDFEQLQPRIQVWQNQTIHANSKLNSEYDNVKAKMKLYQAEMEKLNQTNLSEKQATKLKQNLDSLRTEIGQSSQHLSNDLIASRATAQKECNQLLKSWMKSLAKEHHVKFILPASLFLYQEGAVDLTPATLALLNHAITKQKTQ